MGGNLKRQSGWKKAVFSQAVVMWCDYMAEMRAALTLTFYWSLDEMWQKNRVVSVTHKLLAVRYDQTAWSKNWAVSLTNCWSWCNETAWPKTRLCHSLAVGHGIRIIRCLGEEKKGIESLTSYSSWDETGWKAIWPFHPQTVGHGMRCGETAWQVIHNKASVTHKLVVGCYVMRASAWHKSRALSLTNYAWDMMRLSHGQK